MIVKATTADAYRLLHEGTLAFARTEQAGMRIDVEYCEKKKAFLTKKINRLEAQIMETKFVQHWKHVYGNKFNMGSSWQLGKMLYDVKKIPPARLTPTGKGSTDDKALSDLNIPELNMILEVRKLTKVRDTYLEAFIREQVNGILHPFFNLNLVRTYRSSSDHPNFQNIPKRDEESMQICRRAIYPRPGHQLVEVDYSGIEVRIAACYHKDPTMLHYINDPKSDMHRDMAKEIFCLEFMDMEIPAHKQLRNAAKNGFVFPQFYGDYYGNNAISLACDWGKLPPGKWKQGQGLAMPSGHLSDHLISHGIKSLEQFTERIKKIEKHFWTTRFPVYAQWKDSWWAQYQGRGYLDMYTGFRCSGVMGKNDVSNYPVQGSAFHCLLWPFIELDKISLKEKWDSRLIGQIHDAMLYDMNPDEREDVIAVTKEVTCQRLPKVWPWIITPLDVDVEIHPVDRSWADK